MKVVSFFVWLTVLESRDINLLAKVHIVKAVVFLVVLYGCKSWTIKKTECWRVYALKFWCWRRLLSTPWTAGGSSQSILKEINPSIIGRTDAEAEAPILWPFDVKNWLTGKDPDAGKDWRQKEKGSADNEMVR